MSKKVQPKTKAQAKAKMKKPLQAKKAQKKMQPKKKLKQVVKSKAKKVLKPKAQKKPVKAQKAQAVKKPMQAQKKPMQMQKTEAKPQAAAVAPQKAAYKVGHYVVYPTHGVGRIVAQETQAIGEVELKMLVISFEKDKMTLRVPVHRATAAGLRPVSTNDEMKKVFVTLKGRARTSRGMWSRRAQEYEAKINSGNVMAVAEVVRDLHQNVDQSERSYSERMIYESALARLVGELAAAEGSDHQTATDKLMKLLRGKIAAANAAAAAKEAA